MKTKKIQKILIALEYKPAAENVGKSEYSKSRTIKAEVVILFVLSEHTFSLKTKALPLKGSAAYLGVIPMQFENIDGLKKWANHLQEKIKNTLGDESISTLIEEGDTAISILSAAKDANADVIALGSYSRKWLENVVMRSIMQEMRRRNNNTNFDYPPKEAGLINAQRLHS